MKVIKNPSNRLLAALSLSQDDLKYERTCMSDTCSHSSHDAGFYFIEVDESLLDGVETHYYHGTIHSHGSTVLLAEYEKDECAATAYEAS